MNEKKRKGIKKEEPKPLIEELTPINISSLLCCKTRSGIKNIDFISFDVATDIIMRDEKKKLRNEKINRLLDENN